MKESTARQDEALVAGAIVAAETILDEVEDDRAQEFADSVRKKLLDIQERLETFNTLTEKQRAMVKNIRRGCDNWLRD